MSLTQDYCHLVVSCFWKCFSCSFFWFLIADREKVLELVWMTFNVLTAAMKDEPVNKIIFMDEIRFKGLIDTVKLLGCFTSTHKVIPSFKRKNSTSKKSRLSYVKDFNLDEIDTNSEKYYQLVICKTILSMATGCFDTWKISQSENMYKNLRIFHPTAVNGLIELLPLFYCDEDVEKHEVCININ